MKPEKESPAEQPASSPQAEPAKPVAPPAAEPLPFGKFHNCSPEEPKDEKKA